MRHTQQVSDALYQRIVNTQRQAVLAQEAAQAVLNIAQEALELPGPIVGLGPSSVIFETPDAPEGEGDEEPVDAFANAEPEQD